MIRFVFSLIWLNLCFSPILLAQSFPHDPSEDMYLFDPELIKSQSVERMESEISYKYDLKPIVFTQEKDIFSFNKEGRIKEIIRIKAFRGRMDSIQFKYFYDLSGNLTSIVKNDPKYTYIDLMEYESSEMVKHEFYQMRRTKNWNEHLSDKFLMWSDSIIKKEHKCDVYNVFGRKYRSYVIAQRQGVISQIKTFDQSGKLMTTSNYEYTDGRLSSMEDINHQNLMFDWKKTFEYDNDRLVTVNYYKEGDLEYIQKIAYDKRQIPELNLKRNEQNKKMNIIKYTVTD